MKSKKATALAVVKLCCRALDGKKAEDLRVFDVSAQSSITDFLILATATSQPHLRAMRVELEKVLDAAQTRIVGIETGLESGWTVVDAFDVMVHLFNAESRAHYGLENLWKDAAEIPLARLLGAPQPKLVKPRAAARRPARRK